MAPSSNVFCCAHCLIGASHEVVTASHVCRLKGCIVPQASLATLGNGVELLAFVETARYDEATSLMRVVQCNRPDMSIAVAEPDDPGSDPLRAVLEADPITESAPAKMLQVESGWGAVVKCQTEEGPTYVFMRDDIVVTPAVVQQTNTTCMAAALDALTVIRTRSAQSFKFKTRLACSDRHTANLAAERCLKAARRDWSFLHTACEIHMSTEAQRQALGLMDDAVSGMIRTAVSLRLGGWMRIFRECLAAEVLDTLDVQQGEAPPEAKAHRLAATTVFCGAGTRRRVVQAIMSWLPNGDWRLRDIVQVFVQPGSAFSRVAIAQIVAKGVCWALAGQHFIIFNRKRWTHADESIGQLGLLEACHGLLSRTYRRWLAKLGCPNLAAKLKSSIDRSVAAAAAPEAAAALPLAGDAGADPALAIADEVPPAEDGLERDAGAEGDALCVVGDEPAGGAMPHGGEGSDAFAEENAKNRKVAADWMADSPLRDLVLARVIMEPYMAILRRQLFIGSEKWERQQHKRSLGEGMPRSARAFLILIAARGELDMEFQHHVRLLLHNTTLWSILPADSMTERTRCLAFRMIAREMADYERLLARRHRSPLFQLFLLLDNQPFVEDKLRAMKAHTPCLLDSFTKAFLDQWDISSEDARMVLLLIAHIAHVDIAKIERWHAWVKRIVVKLGALSKRPNLYDVVARNLQQKVKAKAAVWRERTPGSSGSAAPRPRAAEEQEPAAKRHRAGGGGAWRSYCSQRMKTGAAQFAEVAADYKELTDEELAEHVRAGAEATERHRRGQPSFGQRQKIVQHVQMKNEAALFNRRHVLTDRNLLEDSHSAIAPALAALSDADYSRGLRVLRMAGRLCSIEQRREDAACELALADFAKGAGAEAVAKLQQALPKLEAALKQCCIVPLRHGDKQLVSLQAVPDAPTISSAAIAAAAAGPDRHAGVQLNRCLDAYWVHRNRPLGDEDWHGPRPDDIRSGETVCSLAGHCLCSIEGRKLRRLRESLYELLKEVSPSESEERSLARDGYLVVRLRAISEQHFFGDDSDSDGALEEENRWWHLSKLMLSPYLPVFADMTTPAFDEEDPVPLDEEVVLQALVFSVWVIETIC